MKKIIALAVAFAAVAIIGSETNAQVQSFSSPPFSFNSGFQFGAGVGAANTNGGFGSRFGGGTFFGRQSVNRAVRPPYFAEFPPVYYSGIVRRPYGISPFAAPAGVVPVELSHSVAPQEPAVVRNPFFDQKQAAPVSVVDKSKEDLKSTDNKSTRNIPTRVTNPFFTNEFNELEPGSIQQVSFDHN